MPAGIVHFQMFQDEGAGCPTITLGSIPDTSKVVVAYSESAAASGGAAPYAYAVTSGSLPTGISLNVNTGALTGTTDLLSADFTFEITATDANGCTGSRTYNVAVNEFFNFLERVQAAGGNVTGTLASAYRTLFKSLNTDRTDIIRFERYATDTFTGFNVPVIHSVDGVTVIGNNLNTNNNFVAGDWSLTGGLKGDGVTKFLQTGVIPNDVPEIGLDSAGVGTWDKIISDSTVFAGCDIGAYSGSTGMFVIPDYLGLFYGGLNDTTVNYAAQTAGFVFLVRTDNTKNQLYKDGVFVAQLVTPSTSKATTEIDYFKRDGLGDWSNATQFGTITTKGLSAAAILRIKNAVTAFDTTIGR